MELFISLLNEHKETAELIAAIITGLGFLGYIGFLIYKNFPKFIKSLVGDHFSKEKEAHLRAAEYRKKISPKIRHILSDLAEELDADRALLLEFENGNSNLVGLPFLYTTATIEVNKLGTNSVAQNYQRVNLLILSKFVEHMEEFGYLFFNSLEDIKGDYPVLCGYLTPGGCKAGIFYTLYDECQAIGFIAVTSLTKDFDKRIMLPKVATAAQSISALLNYNKIKHELE